MTYRSILVALDETPGNTTRVEIAIALARRFEAHLIGLAPVGAIEVEAFQAAAALIDAAASAQEAMLRQARAAALDFHQRCEAAALPSFEALTDEVPTATSLARHAQCADLLIMSQPDPAVPGHRRSVADLEQVLLRCARPVLLIPYAHCEPVQARRVLVTYDGSRESVRAMTDSLPLLREASSVALLHWGRAGAEEATAGRLACMRQWLAFQGVEAEAHDEVTPLAIGDALLNAASDRGGDLIVMGAYGHGRWSERLFGGTSRTLLESMTVPVLMSN